MRHRGYPLVLGVLLAGVSAFSSPVTVLYTNDLHARLDRLEALEGQIAQERRGGGPVLLVDAGDTWQDFRLLRTAVWGAEETVAWMNRVGYTAMALGNHDLYFGPERLAALSTQAEFPLLCANLVPSPGMRAPFVPYTIVSCDGLRVAVIGLITAEYLPYGEFPWLRYADPAAALAAALEGIIGRADLVLVLAHLPVAEARRIAQTVPGVDLFVTGHSHEETPEPIRVGETLIVQAGAFGRALGRLRLDLDPASGKIERVENTLLYTERAPTDVGRGLVRVLEVILLLGLFCALFLF